MADEIRQIELQIMELSKKLEDLRRNVPAVEVKNYTFETLNGKTTLLDLFGNHDKLVAIHNMGQGCRYCTLWADGFNAFLPHLESRCAVVLLSKDSPETQRRFAMSRGWKFRMASHGGKDYIVEQSLTPGETNQPGMVCYERKGNTIIKTSSSFFGPGDPFCSIWHILSLAGIDDFTPQYSYWKRPEKMDDGGENLL